MKTNFAEEYRRLLKKRIDTHEEALTFREPFIREAIWLFAEDIPAAIDFLRKECTEDEYSWISEIIEDIAAESESVELIQAYADLAVKYPEETKRYNIQSFIDSALAIAESYQDEDE